MANVVVRELELLHPEVSLMPAVRSASGPLATSGDVVRSLEAPAPGLLLVDAGTPHWRGIAAHPSIEQVPFMQPALATILHSPVANRRSATDHRGVYSAPCAQVH